MFLYHTKKFVCEQKEIGFNHTITDDEYGTPSKWTLLTGWLVKNAPHPPESDCKNDWSY